MDFKRTVTRNKGRTSRSDKGSAREGASVDVWIASVGTSRHTKQRLTHAERLTVIQACRGLTLPFPRGWIVQAKNRKHSLNERYIRPDGLNR